MVLFISVFLVARVFVLSDYNITSVALFLLMDCTALFVFYLISTTLSKKIPCVWLTRLATLSACIFILLTILLPDGLKNHYMLFGLLWGMTAGTHWGSLNFLTSNVLSKAKAFSYYVYIFVLLAIVGILFPFTFGFAIDYGNWVITSSFVLGVGILQLFFSFLVKPEKQETPQDKKLHFVNYFKVIKSNGHMRHSVILWCAIACMSSTYLLSAIMTILIFTVYGSNMSLGVMGSIFAAIGIVFIIMYKNSKPAFKSAMFWTSAITPLLVSIILYFYIGPWSIIVFNGAIVCRNISEIESNPARMNATKLKGCEMYSAESLMIYECAYYTGRWITCGLLLIAGLFQSVTILLPIMISVILFAYFTYSILISFYKKSYEKVLTS